MLEELAERFKGDTTDFRINDRDLRDLFRIRSWNELDSFCVHLSNVRGMNVKRNGNVFEIKAPILSELLGRDFRSARQLKQQTAPKNKIKNKDIDKEIKKEKPSIILDLESAYNLYPLKNGKSDGLRKLKSQLKTEKDLSDFKIAIENYKKDLIKNKTESKYIKHFNTFVSTWRDWLLEGHGEAIEELSISGKAFSNERSAEDQLSVFNEIFGDNTNEPTT